MLASNITIPDITPFQYILGGVRAAVFCAGGNVIRVVALNPWVREVYVNGGLVAVQELSPGVTSGADEAH